GVPYRPLRTARGRDALARPGLVRLDPVERLGDVELGHLRAVDRAVDAAPADLLTLAHRAVRDPADREPAGVRRCVEGRDARLERMALLERRRGDGAQERLEERFERLFQAGRIG